MAHHPPRLVQVDGLRALAALSVVAFHYTTRYDELFLHTGAPPAYAPDGDVGVLLFFAISGFVIHMTLDRVKSPLDFIASRAIRLYPAYWAAVIVTWATITALQLPGYAVPARVMLYNLAMVQGWFGVPDVNGVYWTLLVELLFYAWMLAFWTSGLLRRAWLVPAWMALAAVASTLEALHHPLPHIMVRFGILAWLPWFGLGIAAYQASKAGLMLPAHWATLALATVAVAIHDPSEVAVALAVAALVFAASRGRLRVFEWRPIVFFGLISYPLYLVHEEMGWAFIWRLESAGFHPAAALAAAFAVTAALAFALHATIETRVSAWLRQAWAARRQGAHRPWRRLPWTAATLAGIACMALAFRLTLVPPESPPDVRGLNIAHGARACDAADRAPVLLVLGQSNAGSHVPSTEHAAARVLVDGRCVTVREPLPRTEGDGSAIWTRLDGFVLSPLAIDDTRLAQWLAGPLRPQLEHVLHEAARSGHPIVAVLWQQGEADALGGTPARDYRDGLIALRAMLDRANVRAPLVVAKSTYCKGRRNDAIRRAVDAAAAMEPRIWVGPDTDALVGELREDGCHFNERGRDAAAALWMPLVQRAASVGRGAP